MFNRQKHLSAAFCQCILDRLWTCDLLITDSFEINLTIKFTSFMKWETFNFSFTGNCLIEKGRVGKHGGVLGRLQEVYLEMWMIDKIFIHYGRVTYRCTSYCPVWQGWSFRICCAKWLLGNEWTSQRQVRRARRHRVERGLTQGRRVKLNGTGHTCRIYGVLPVNFGLPSQYSFLQRKFKLHLK